MVTRSPSTQCTLTPLSPIVVRVTADEAKNFSFARFSFVESSFEQAAKSIEDAATIIDSFLINLVS